ncbi:1-(5-phosphoribosyl)-5-[(5-phosphoribosylamino)methylideneamino]imidazole-4-carboxamide isomerase [Roseimaritima sediminicola]|uniref:1-(5-phosphoribosyl)-5-[(5- phosphoribosylamino)methylideneamino]imidazole-4- carboxamide isomerase n=1 Tax=Roseimaritima sediminicola TaxID=2662066 RepID=UPI0012982EF8|nr:1-(5-phosphoribosyl)-5-[(5-phosphoribosylamino)methylideneamino]imidazole-4-carboxamide isomerase [Roseimaritima sediminicola]
MEIWPAIDLRHGRCVRLQQGDYERETVFGEDPAAMARRWVVAGARRLHLVDLDAARGDDPTENLAAVRAILQAVDVPCQLGGGVRSEAIIEELLDMGLARLVVGSAALKRPEWFAQMCDAHPRRLAAGIDAREGMVATDGWLETSSTPAVTLAKDLRSRTENIAAIIYTDIAKDGMLEGPNLQGLQEMAAATDIPLVASGGVTTLDDIRALVDVDMPAAIIGRALYEGRLDLPEVLEVAGEQ